jgi:hypothetical protein
VLRDVKNTVVLEVDLDVDVDVVPAVLKNVVYQFPPVHQ